VLRSRVVSEPIIRVTGPPPKPLLVYDGDCAFCKLWVERWREETGEAVDDAPLQEAAARFPEVPREEFEHAVKLIDPDGRVWSGAAAVFRSLGAGGRRLNRWSYDHLPGFAAMTEAAYRFIAGHRELAHRVTWLFWGNDVRRPTYFRAREWFLRALGAIYLIAFLSFWVQADGLIGEGGILPVSRLIQAAREQLGADAWHIFPTLCWFNASNSFLHFLCGAGAVISVLLILGLAPILCLVLLFACYLSLTVAGQTFFSFQWDILLLETGFLAIFLAPWRWWPRRGPPAPLSPIALFLLQFLLFKLMFMSGVVKLTGGDPSWLNLTALDYHYWTQPLPTVLGWWADKSPEWLKHFSTAATLVIEMLVPFLIWGSRRLRLLCFWSFLTLQIVIGLTGNYAFFNLLSVALCLLLIDDAVWPARHRGQRPRLHPAGWRWPLWVPALVFFVTMPLNGFLLFNAFQPTAEWPAAMGKFYQYVEPFRIVSGYGLFRVMTKDRPEIIIEGSADGIEWKPYIFKWKPGPLDRAPGWVQPHQPRLDWQMWFAALSDVRQNPWFFRLVQRLLENSPDVTQLLAINPFPNQPPRYLRAELYRYHFSTVAGHRKNDVWWQRQDLREYLPEVSLH
jgi:predicted DCC family thiol-disulfide oxidoreductase YuxK